MRPIKITAANAEKISEAVAAIEGNRVSIRTLHWHSIASAVEDIEKDLSRRLYKKDWIGLTISADTHAQKFPNSYKGTPESTHFTIERRASGWFLTDVCRSRCGSVEYSIDLGGCGDLLVEFAEKNFCK